METEKKGPEEKPKTKEDVFDYFQTRRNFLKMNQIIKRDDLQGTDIRFKLLKSWRAGKEKSYA